MRPFLVLASLFVLTNCALAQAPAVLPTPPSDDLRELWRHGRAGDEVGRQGLVVADVDRDHRVEVISVNRGLGSTPDYRQSEYERQPDGTWRPVMAHQLPLARAIGHVVLDGRSLLLYAVALPGAGTELRAFDGRTRERVATVHLTDDEGDRETFRISVIDGGGDSPPLVYVTGHGTTIVDPSTWSVVGRSARQVVVHPDLVGEMDGTPGREVVQFYDVFDAATLEWERELPQLAAGDVTSAHPLALFDANGDGVDEALYPFFRRDSEYWIEAIDPASAASAGRWTIPEMMVFEVGQVFSSRLDTTGPQPRFIFGTDWELVSLNLDTGGVEWATGVLQRVNGVWLSDLDLDGDTDAVGTGWGTFKCVGCGLMVFDGSTGEMTWAGSAAQGAWSNVEVADVDEDGDLEAVYGVNQTRYSNPDDPGDPFGEYRYFQNEPVVVVADATTGDVERTCALVRDDGGYPPGHQPSLLFGHIGGLAIGEVDGDVSLDIVLAAVQGYAPAVHVLDPVTCELSAPVVVGDNTDSINLRGVVLVDPDGDGISTAYAVGGARDADRWIVPAIHEIDLVRGAVTWTHTGGRGPEYRHPAAVDATGDGRADIMVLREPSGETPASVITLDLSTRTTSSVPTSDATSFTPIDRDGDGGADAVIVGVTEFDDGGFRRGVHAYDLGTGSRFMEVDLGEGVAGDVAYVASEGLVFATSQSNVYLIDLASGAVVGDSPIPPSSILETIDPNRGAGASVYEAPEGGLGLFASSSQGVRAFGLNAWAGGREAPPEPAALRVYPNPAMSLVRVFASSVVGAVTVHDVLGRRVRTLAADAARRDWEIEVSDFPVGTYVVRAGPHSALFTVAR